MVFLSSYSAIAKLSYLIGDSVLLAISSWKVMRFGELEDDHLNPTDYSRECNKLYPIEVAIHAGLTVWLFMHFEIMLVVLNLPYLAWTIKNFLDGSYLVDASKVFSPQFKQDANKKLMVTAGFLAIMWIVYLVTMVNTVIEVGSLTKQRR